MGERQRTIAAALAAAILSASAAHAEPANLAKWNADFNAHHPIRWGFDGFSWADEGRDGYDCKGIVVLKARALHDLGVPWADMTVLIVDSGRAGWQHAVLAVDGTVLDEGPWTASAAGYSVQRTQDAWTFSMVALAWGMR